MFLTFFFFVLFCCGRVPGHASLHAADCHHSSAKHRYPDCMGYTVI